MSIPDEVRAEARRLWAEVEELKLRVEADERIFASDKKTIERLEAALRELLQRHQDLLVAGNEMILPGWAYMVIHAGLDAADRSDTQS